MFKRTLSEPIFLVSDSQTIEFHFENQDEYFISEGISPSKINWNSHITTTQQNLTLPKKSVRPFFGITNSAGEKLIVAERKLIVPGLDNFRDLGGLKTMNNTFIAWNTFFRSDALHKINDSAFCLLDYLQIKQVFDLRSDAEIAVAKDNLPANISYLNLPIFDSNSSCLIQGIQENYKNGTLNETVAQELLFKTYETFAIADHSKFNKLLNQIFKQDATSSLFHCTAGKDRTGFTAALILLILGVDKQTVLDEYEMTNFYTQQQIDLAMKHGVIINGVQWHITSDVIKTLLSVNRAFLEHAINLIEANFGGIDSYIKNQLGFNNIKRKYLQEKYTYKV